MRKNQLKRLSLEKLHQYSKQTTNGQSLNMVNEVIVQRNDILRSKAIDLKKQIEKVRKQTKKVIKQMNEAVRDRLAKKQKIVMDKNSRPTAQNIKELSQLYTYIQNQTQLIDRNNKNIDNILSAKCQYSSSIQIQIDSLNPEQKYTELDNKYKELNKQCAKQEKILLGKKGELQQFKSHIDNIHSTIEQYRIKYEEVESVIRERQRELDHLVTYFKNRKQEDHDNLERQRRLSNVIERELLQNQQNFNKNFITNQHLQIMEIQCMQKL